MSPHVTAGLVLSLALSILAGPALAQESSPEPPASPEPSPSVSAEDPATPGSVTFDEPRWQKISTERSPAAREDHTWTVDPDGRYAYLFGGRDGGRDLGDLWRYDLESDTWKKLSPTGPRPAARFGHSAVWVESHGLIVFAGQRGPDFFDDLWAYDPAADAWRELPARGAVPKRRYGSCMVVGPDGRLWISHGFTFAGRFDDTRAYNLRSERWASIAPDRRRPGERCLHDCFTSASGEMVLYGGQDDGQFALGDLWVMGRERAWERLPDPRPKARRLYAVAEAGDVAYVFGGAGQDNGLFDDLWQVDRTTLEFERIRPEGKRPGARSAGTLISDPARDRLLLFGGQGKVAKADTWELVEAAETGDGAPAEVTVDESPEVPGDEEPSPSDAG